MPGAPASVPKVHYSPLAEQLIPSKCIVVLTAVLIYHVRVVVHKHSVWTHLDYLVEPPPGKVLPGQ